MELREIKNFLTIMITNAVRDIQQTIFKVEVANQIEIPKEIEIKNLKEVQKIAGEVEVKKIDEVISNLKKIKEKEIKFPEPLEEIKIKDFDKLINKKEKDIIIPDEVKIENLDGIVALLKEIKNKKIPDQKDIKIPDSVKISNLGEIPKIDEVSLKNLNQLIEALGSINFLSNDPERPIAVRLSDGKYFYKTLTEIVDRVISSGGVNNVGIRNVANERINPSTEDTLEILKDKFTVHREHIKTIGFKEAIGHGATDGNIKVERASGKKIGIGTGDFALIESHAFVQPSVNTQMYLQSTDAQDSAAGTGIQLITIEYFESAWGARKSINVIPDGLNQVTFSVANIHRIHRVYGAKGHSAVGDISITNQAANILYGQIDANHTYMERCIFYVAEGETITCTEAILGSVTSGGVQIRLFATEEDADGNTLTRGRLPFEIVSGSLDSTFSVSESIRNPNNKRMSIGLVVKAAGTAANQSVTGALKGYRCIC